MYFPALTLSVQLSRSDVWIIQTALCLSAVAIKHANKQQQNLQSENHEQKLAVGVEAIILSKKKDQIQQADMCSTQLLTVRFFFLSTRMRPFSAAGGWIKTHNRFFFSKKTDATEILKWWAGDPSAEIKQKHLGSADLSPPQPLIWSY